MRRCHREFRGGSMFSRLFEAHHFEGRGPGRHHQRGGGRMEEAFGRMLGHGDLRYVILSLLEEKPRHGYEIIKALEEKSSGQYSPSPGVIYPTLTFLEDGGFASVTEENKKKLYTITEEGKTLLEENRDMVEAILTRMSHMGQKMSKLQDWFGRDNMERSRDKEGMHTIRTAMHTIRAELFNFLDSSAAQKKQIAEILERAAEEIRKLKG